ncbi:hypothetical protein BLOT_015723, partial [Blomia tropicalis]
TIGEMEQKMSTNTQDTVPLPKMFTVLMPFGNGLYRRSMGKHTKPKIEEEDTPEVSNHFIIIITGKNILGEGVPKDERGDEIYFQCGFRVVPSHFGKHVNKYGKKMMPLKLPEHRNGEHYEDISIDIILLVIYPIFSFNFNS